MSNDLKMTSPEDKKWAMVIHLAALTGLLLPLGLVLGPLLVWMLKRNDSDFLNEQGKRAVNFQLTILIAAFAVAVLSAVIRPLIAVTFMLGLLGLLFAIVAGININNGKDFQYPFSIKLFK